MTAFSFNLLLMSIYCSKHLFPVVYRCVQPIKALQCMLFRAFVLRNVQMQRLFIACTISTAHEDIPYLCEVCARERRHNCEKWEMPQVLEHSENYDFEVACERISLPEGIAIYWSPCNLDTKTFNRCHVIFHKYPCCVFYFAHRSVLACCCWFN